MFGLVDLGDSFLFRQIFNDSSYWYELAARRSLELKEARPAYPLGKPFNPYFPDKD